MYSCNWTLIHFHLGRTGGIFFRENVLHRKYKSALRYITVNRIHKNINNYPMLISDISSMNDDQKKMINCVTGHLPFGVHKLFPQQCKYISLVRDPIDRVISEYYSLNDKPEHPFNKYYLSNKKISFEDYIRYDIFNETGKVPEGIYMGTGVKNQQTRFINGILYRSALGDLAPPYDDTLEKAIENIKQYFLLIGTVEQYERFLLLLMKKMKWNFRDIFHSRKKMNVSSMRPEKEELPKKIIKLIEKYNSDDMELYDYVKKQFERQIDNYPNFNQDLEKFQKLNRFYGSFYSRYIYHFPHKLISKFDSRLIKN